MTLPTIHDNGTSARMLSAAAEAAYDALQTAYDLLKQTAPNARDYDDSRDCNLAVAQHLARVQKIADVMTDLETLIGHCDQAGDPR